MVTNWKTGLRRCIGGCNLLFCSVSPSERVCGSCRKSFTKKQKRLRGLPSAEVSPRVSLHLSNVSRDLEYIKSVSEDKISEALEDILNPCFNSSPNKPLKKVVNLAEVKLSNIIKKVKYVNKPKKIRQSGVFSF